MKRPQIYSIVFIILVILARLPEGNSREYVGCHKDSHPRLLEHKAMADPQLTIQECIDVCSQRGYTLAGTEFTKECFCGNDLKSNTKRDESQCNMPCGGNPSEICGGSWRISVYKANGLCGGIKCHAKATCRAGKCVCMRGFYDDGNNGCGKTYMCMASGDPHYCTFDGQMIHFMGACKYVLAKSVEDGDECSFNVEVKNEHRRGNTRVSYTRLVDVHIYGKTIRLLNKEFVLIDEQKKYFPVNDTNGKLRVSVTGNHVQVTTQCGLKVSFDCDDVVTVVVPDIFRNKTTGICGDLNGVKDDFKTKEGIDVTNDNNRDFLIGSSYAVVDDSDKPGEECKTENVTFECKDETKELAKGPSLCGKLENREGPFAECIEKIPDLAKQYFDSCVIDVCSNIDDMGFLEDLKCHSIQAFAEECAENGIKINWRTTEFCPIECSDPNSVYTTEGTGCPATCVERDAPANCVLDSQEGCYCKAEFVLSGNKCVREAECGCRDVNGDYYPIGTRKKTNNCEYEYICLFEHGETKFKQIGIGKKCHEDADCRFESGERRCMCKTGFVGDGYECTESDCSVSVEHSSCVSVVKVSGNCMYSSKFSFQCEYTIRTNRLRSDTDVVVNGRPKTLTNGLTIKDCAVFYNMNGMVTVTDNICERCTLGVIRNFMPQSTCPRP